MKDEELENHIRASLDAHAQPVDELTRASLRAARYRALEHMPAQRRPWWQPGLAFASVLLALAVAWDMQPLAGDTDSAMGMAEDAAVIADLDLVLWLEGSDV